MHPSRIGRWHHHRSHSGAFWIEIAADWSQNWNTWRCRRRMLVSTRLGDPGPWNPHGPTHAHTSSARACVRIFSTKVLLHNATHGLQSQTLSLLVGNGHFVSGTATVSQASPNFSHCHPARPIFLSSMTITDTSQVPLRPLPETMQPGIWYNQVWRTCINTASLSVIAVSSDL